MSENKWSNRVCILGSLLMFVNMLVVHADSGVGGSCQMGGMPIDFNYSCNYTEINDQKAYTFQFQGIAAKDANAALPLIVKNVYLQMGTNIQMVPVMGATNTFYYSNVNNLHPPADYSFIYQYKLNSGEEVQCQTPIYEIVNCHKQ